MIVGKEEWYNFILISVIVITYMYMCYFENHTRWLKIIVHNVSRLD